MSRRRHSQLDHGPNEAEIAIYLSFKKLTVTPFLLELCHNKGKCTSHYQYDYKAALDEIDQFLGPVDTTVRNGKKYAYND